MPPLAVPRISRRATRSRVTSSDPLTSVTMTRGLESRTVPSLTATVPSNSGAETWPDTPISSPARPAVSTSRRNAPSVRRSIAPTIRASTDGVSPIVTVPPRLNSLAPPLQFERSTVRRPPSSRNRVGIVWLNGTWASISSTWSRTMSPLIPLNSGRARSTLTVASTRPPSSASRSSVTNPSSVRDVSSSMRPSRWPDGGSAGAPQRSKRVARIPRAGSGRGP